MFLGLLLTTGTWHLLSNMHAMTGNGTIENHMLERSAPVNQLAGSGNGTIENHILECSAPVHQRAINDY